MKMQKMIIWFVIIGLVAVVNCNRKTRYGIAGKGEKVEILTLAEINDNPQTYINKECTVKGYVTAILDFPYMTPDGFKIFDGTDEIWIYTHRGVPPLNFSVIVKGKLKNLLGGLINTPLSLTVPIVNRKIEPEMQFYIELKELKFE